MTAPDLTPVEASHMIANVALACSSMRKLLAIASQSRPTQRDELGGLIAMLGEVQSRCDRLAPDPPRIERVVPRLLVTREP